MKLIKITALVGLGVFAVVVILIIYFKFYRPLNPAVGPLQGDIVNLLEESANQLDDNPAGEVVTRAEPVNETRFPLTLPAGVKLSVFAEEVDNARLMTFDSDGVLYLSQTRSAQVIALPDADQDGKADKSVEIISGLDRPHGLLFVYINEIETSETIGKNTDFIMALLPEPEFLPATQNLNGQESAVVLKEYLYVAETNRVIRLPKTGYLSFGPVEVIIDDLPPGGSHFTRTLAVSGAKLYVATGSSCNVCEEQDPQRATIWQYDLDGGNGRVYATGLRNAVGLEFHPLSGQLWATENGRDQIGDDVPPDEINIITEDGFYGWPICYGRNIHDTSFDQNTYSRNPCQEPTELPSYVDLPAHVAPLGLEFYKGEMFPEMKNDLLIALHGSWNRSVPVGYKIIKIQLEGEKVISQEDFISGWLQKSTVAGITSYSSLGRPVDVLSGPGGEIYISDDKAGVVYIVTKS